ncbi:hypothetical protein CEXT_215491 [Caerostris extrusa]|uniref:Uncharacterized protein n=1 Tax=Caerostris extrusa TaxID=172846 RepID=A0AAV4PIX0_CAEEX|nr:hypothetical protein CEXT_215491 [Caerostris extrusa]
MAIVTSSVCISHQGLGYVTSFVCVSHQGLDYTTSSVCISHQGLGYVTSSTCISHQGLGYVTSSLITRRGFRHQQLDQAHEPMEYLKHTSMNPWQPMQVKQPVYLKKVQFSCNSVKRVSRNKEFNTREKNSQLLHSEKTKSNLQMYSTNRKRLRFYSSLFELSCFIRLKPLLHGDDSRTDNIPQIVFFRISPEIVPKIEI